MSIDLDTNFYRLCVECKHHAYNDFNSTYFCYHPSNLNKVDGGPINTCQEMRHGGSLVLDIRCSRGCLFEELKRKKEKPKVKPDPISERPWYWRLTRLWSDKY